MVELSGMRYNKQESGWRGAFSKTGGGVKKNELIWKQMSLKNLSGSHASLRTSEQGSRETPSRRKSVSNSKKTSENAQG